MQLSLDVGANQFCKEIMLEVWIDEQKIYETVATPDLHTINAQLTEEPGNHVLKLVMLGKLPQHTVCDTSGNILSDIYFQIFKLEFEELDMQNIFCQGLPIYTHSFNSTQAEFVDEFYGMLGCNGIVEIRFSTPIFLWLTDYLI
jgi:hypothetical protein